jgi:hypothetical protein
MSHRSTQRDRYFAKEIASQPDAASYLNALNHSPFKVHQRVYKVLREVPAEMQKQKDSLEFKEKLGL